jgi:transcriptional regulator with XRE-family HTH domain
MWQIGTFTRWHQEGSFMAQGENPIVEQRRLRSELRRLRETGGHYQKDVADALEWSTSKLIRIETGAVGISKTDLIALLHHYGVKDQKKIDELTEMARTSRQRAWWDKYREFFSAQFITFLGFEASAKLIRQFQTLTVPGLLQTREYSTALLNSFNTPPDRIPLGVDVRMERQQVVGAENPPELFYILDEAVLRRWVGGPDVMRKQLEHLKQLNRQRNITIQIVRFDIGAYIGMKGSFTVFEFPHDETDYAVLLEYPDRDVLIQNNPVESSKFVETFFELEAISTPVGDTEKVIDEILAGLPGGKQAAKKGADDVPAVS